MLKIGHRGACGHAPENTLASFAKALELGVDAVELDVHICATGEPVVIHDATLERTTNGRGKVVDAALSVLKTLDAGQGEAVPTLADVLDLIDRRASVFIELKSEDSAAPVAALINHYVRQKRWKYEQLIAISFQHDLLVEVKRIHSEIFVGPLYDKAPVDCLRAKQMGAFSVNPNHALVNLSFVQDARAQGLKMMVWTVNEPADIARMKALGVDGIMSDYPERL